MGATDQARRAHQLELAWVVVPHLQLSHASPVELDRERPTERALQPGLVAPRLAQLDLAGCYARTGDVERVSLPAPVCRLPKASQGEPPCVRRRDVGEPGAPNPSSVPNAASERAAGRWRRNGRRRLVE